MPKSLRSLNDHVLDTLESSRRTKSGRFQPVVPGTERVADVISTSCASVAEAFSGMGFRWAKSGLRFSRKVGSFTHIISFQADSANLSGSHVGVAIHAQSKCAELAKWRDMNGLTTGDNIWNTQIGYLSPTHEYLKWQLVDPIARQAEVASMVKTIHELAMPAFDVCSTKEKLAAHLLERREITWIADWAVDVALWAGNKAAAEILVREHLSSRQGALMAPFMSYLQAEVVNPSPERPSNRTHSLAWVVCKHGLQVPSAS